MSFIYRTNFINFILSQSETYLFDVFLDSLNWIWFWDHNMASKHSPVQENLSSCFTIFNLKFFDNRVFTDIWTSGCIGPSYNRTICNRLNILRFQEFDKFVQINYLKFYFLTLWNVPLFLSYFKKSKIFPKKIAKNFQIFQKWEGNFYPFIYQSKANLKMNNIFQNKKVLRHRFWDF